LLEVLRKASVAAEPGQRSFDDPSAGQDLKALGGIGSLDDLDGPFADAAQRLAQLVAGIATIGEEMAQPREAVDNFGEQQRRPVTPGYRPCGLWHGPDCLRCRSGYADCGPSSCPHHSREDRRCRWFDALAVDDAGAGRGFTAMNLARGHQQEMVQRLPQTVVAPNVKPAPDGRYRREARWQHPPRQATHVADTGSSRQSAASTIGEDARHAMAVARRVRSPPIQRRSSLGNARPARA